MYIIRSLQDICSLPAGTRVLCLFSGGLDGAYLISYLVEHTDLQISTLSVILGDDVDAGRREALSRIFKIDSHSVDKAQEFAEEFVIPAIQAQATYLGTFPISASLSRPLIARTACDFAKLHDCGVILHTSNTSQNSLRRFNGALRDLGFEGRYGSPFERDPVPRDEKALHLQKLGLSDYSTRGYGSDVNFWATEVEYGALDDPEAVDLSGVPFVWVRKASESARNTVVNIEFEKGRPTRINGEAKDFIALVERLNRTVGAFGIGQYVGLEEVERGSKVQEVREMPGAQILLDAYRRLESACVDSETIRVKMGIEQIWVREAVEGRWFGSLRKPAQAFTSTVAESVSGEVAYSLESNIARVISVKALRPLYVRDRTTYEAENAKRP
jgi:argininosuccinate synthase